MAATLISTLLIVGLVIFVYVTAWFIISLLLKRNDVADVAWGPGIALVGITAFFLQEETTARMAVLALLGVIWGLRLSLHIGSRAIKKSEDSRYKAWRESWGAWFIPRSYLQVFLLQGLLMIVVGYTFVHVSVFDGGTGAFGVLGSIGVLVWLVGFLFEVIGDWQLWHFMAKPENKGRVMTGGLWRYTRHPNYFGEVTLWWGIWLIAFPVSWSIVALVSPLMITFLILKVSGIPMLEKRFEGNTEFEAYKKRTSAFFPWSPRVDAV